MRVGEFNKDLYAAGEYRFGMILVFSRVCMCVRAFRIYNVTFLHVISVYVARVRNYKSMEKACTGAGQHCRGRRR